MIEVNLSPAELQVAAVVGVARQIQALREGRRHLAGAPDDAGWFMHIEGAAGEMAFAKAVGVYWGAPVGTFKTGGDVGAIQVRTRSRHDWGLIVRPGDRVDDAFVHVTGTAPNFRVHGWMTGGAAMKPEWLREHGGRPAAYFVPTSALFSLHSLPKEQIYEHD